jgi:uncharacterized membrane protein
MKELKNLDWKESLFKSIIYRIITVTLGFFTTLLITGDITLALGIASITEAVQFGNYFVFEMLWTNLRTRKRFEEEFINKTIELKINYESVIEIAYEMCRIDTFVEKIYDSAFNFFNSTLNNENLKAYHEDIEKYFGIFKRTHKNREFAKNET